MMTVYIALILSLAIMLIPLILHSEEVRYRFERRFKRRMDE